MIMFGSVICFVANGCSKEVYKISWTQSEDDGVVNDQDPYIIFELKDF